MPSQKGTVVDVIFDNPCCPIGVSAYLKICQICLVELESKINMHVESGSRWV